MKVLVACEESQRVCIAFRALGHESYSCDIKKCSGGFPEWHIIANVLSLLNGNCMFFTADGVCHKIFGKWDLIVAHPPCTYLTVTGNRWYNVEKYGLKAIQRKLYRDYAIQFFMSFVYADCDKIAIENPVGIMSTYFRKPDCIYNPYDFIGETECKRTCLWLKGLPPLKPTRVIPLPTDKRTHGIYNAYFDNKQFSWNDSETARLRSQTPLGVARAMAEQWSK